MRPVGLLLEAKQTKAVRKRTWGLNVACWGISRRSAEVVGTSLISQERTQDNSSRSALARIMSGVTKPSVNQEPRLR